VSRPGDAGPGIALLDVSDNSQLEAIGTAIAKRAQRAPILVVGASSVAQALIAHWRSPPHARDGKLLPANGPVLAMAGSLSPVTAQQIAAASRYDQIPLAPERLAHDEAYLHEQARNIMESLRAGRHTLAYTSPASARQPSMIAGIAKELAAATGALLRTVLRNVAVTRVGIAGGDTSSHAVEALECWGLEWLGQLDSGVPLLRARADQPTIDGLELMLKGGQMGGPDLFDRFVGVA